MGMTVVDVCNQALARLGAEKILGLDDGSKGARFCRLFYEQTRDEVLRSHPWNFAMKREVLSRLVDEPVFGWKRQYQLPPDFLRLVQLNGFAETEAARNSEIEGNTLLCDEDEAQVRYVRRMEDAGLFDPLFAEALAMKLASKLAQPLTGSRTLGAEILREYERITAPLARRIDSQEDRPVKEAAVGGECLCSIQARTSSLAGIAVTSLGPSSRAGNSWCNPEPTRSTRRPRTNRRPQAPHR